MTENITNRSDLEEASQARLIQHYRHQPKPGKLQSGALLDECPLPKGMREKVETIEVSTLKPKA